MEVQKKYLILILIICAFSTCDSNDEQIAELIKENQRLRIESEEKIKLMGNWFNDFSIISSEINSIETFEVSVDNYSNEIYISGISDRDKILNKINAIRQKLIAKENGLKEIKINVEGLRNVVRSLKTSLLNKEKIITALRERIKVIQQENMLIRGENAEFASRNKGLESQNKVLLYDSNRRYVTIIAKNKSEVYELYDDKVYIDCKPRKVEIITSHPANSYSITRNGKQSILKINDSYSFWQYSKILVIKLRARIN